MTHIRWLGESVASLAQAWRERGDHSLLLRYEDLVLRPFDAVEALLGELALPATPNIVEAMIGRLRESYPGLAEHRTTPTADESVGRWRRDLEPRLQRLSEETFATGLEVFGYD